MRDQPYTRDGVGYIPLRRRDKSTAAWAVVDLADFEDVARFNWHRGSHGYACRRSGGAIVLMHRYLLGLTPGDVRQGDHKDRDPLNYRRENLRIVPGHAANHQNVGSYKGAVSFYRGVSWDKQESKWRAQAMINGRRVHLGRFDDEAEAGRAAAAFRLKHMPYATS